MGVPPLKTPRDRPHSDASGPHRPAPEAGPEVVADRSTPFVSVVIPVFNDPDRLRTCLQALEHQTYPKDRYEVIVVDNGSAQTVGPLVDEFRQARSTYEKVPGTAAARNRGIALASGEVLAFTDADCIPAHDWLAKGVPRLLGTPDCGLLAGHIEVFFRDPEHPTAAEAYDALTAFPQTIL
nr:glycosyltransferase family 2 protein [Chloroflexota bacterium]